MTFYQICGCFLLNNHKTKPNQSNGLEISEEIFITFFLTGSNHEKKVSMLNFSCGGGHLEISNPQKGGNQSTWRKPLTCYKSLTNFIT
jgi:hypothetical protein